MNAIAFKKKIGIVGVKQSGFETAHFILTDKESSYFDVTLFDDKPDMERISALTSINPEVHLYPLSEIDKLSEQDLLVVSPGIPVTHPSLVQAHHAGAEIIGDIELWARIKQQSKNPNLVSAKVIGITGSNGKTTVTELTTHILNTVGAKATKAGNVGVPILSTMKEDFEVYVLELSSFQLETCTDALELNVGTILNVSEDHLDRYDSMADYIDAKQRIYDFSNRILYNRDDTNTYPRTAKNITKGLTAFSSQSEKPASYHYDPETKTLNIPTPYNMELGHICIPIKNLKLRGRHNYENILAAIALVRNVYQPNEALDKLIIGAIETFEGLPHRYELVHTSNSGVQFINDSKATNVGSVIAALKSSDWVKGNIYLLMGGIGKNQDFKQLEDYVNADNIKLFCYGRDAKEVAVASNKAKVLPGESLEGVMNLIYPHLQKNDVVLLSPGCASQDQFKNYEERGAKFAEFAKKYQKPSKIKAFLLGGLSIGQQAVHKLMYLGGSSLKRDSYGQVNLYDSYFLGLIISIFSLGLITVISSSVYYAEAKVGSFINLLQLIPVAIGVFFFFFATTINTNKWQNMLAFIIIFTLLMLVAVLSIGISIGGAKRWISLAGFTFQPAELAKFTTILYLAHYLVEVGKEKGFKLQKMLGFAVYLGVTAALLLMEPDFGTTLMLTVVTVLTTIFILPDLKTAFKALPPIIILGVVVIFASINQLEYLVRRLEGFIDPLADPYGKSYQIVNSLSAFAHGGF